MTTTAEDILPSARTRVLLTKLNFEVCFKINELQNSKPQPYYGLTKNGKITVRVEELRQTHQQRHKRACY